MAFNPNVIPPDPDEKSILEEEKLRLEVSELRHWWRRPSYIQTILSTLIAFLALIAGWVNGWFDIQKKSLENQRAEIRMDIRDLEDKRNELQKKLAGFDVQLDNARKQIAGLSKTLDDANMKLSLSANAKSSCESGLRLAAATIRGIGNSLESMHSGYDPGATASLTSNPYLTGPTKSNDVVPDDLRGNPYVGEPAKK